MSMEAVGWMWGRLKTGVGDGPFVLVALTLADRADDSGFVRPVSRKKVAELSRTSVSTVSRRLDQLKEAGLVQVLQVRDDDGRTSESAYWLPIDGMTFSVWHEDSHYGLGGVRDFENLDPEMADMLERYLTYGPQGQSDPRTGSLSDPGGEVLSLPGLDLPEVKEKTPRPRDLAFEALAEVTNFDPAARGARAQLNAALRDIRRMWEVEWAAFVSEETNATPTPDSFSVAAGSQGDAALADEIRARGRILRDRWNRSYAPGKLATWWKDAGKDAAEVRELFG